MVGIALNKGKVFSDFDCFKNEEWLHRRKLRIEQVRKQSKDIAKVLRQKVENEGKIQSKELEKIEDIKFKCWKAEKLDEMERKLRYALEEFGLGHKLSELEPCPEEIIKVESNINYWKAQERGKLANSKQNNKIKAQNWEKNYYIETKKRTRKFEDLRSALVCSVSNKKHLLQQSNISEIPSSFDIKKKTEKHATIVKKKIRPTTHSNASKIIVKKINSKKKKKQNLKGFTISHQNKNNKSFPEMNSSRANMETVWINLNDVQNSSLNCNKTLKKGGTSNENIVLPSKTNSEVEFYDYHSKYPGKLYREVPNLIEKIEKEPKTEQNSIIEILTSVEKSKLEKRQKAIIASEKRGNEALRKEKTQRTYNNLILKLDELSKKEKLIKAESQILNTSMYMNDDRLFEKAKIKQRIMNSKFEGIFYGEKFETFKMDSNKTKSESFSQFLENRDRISINAPFPAISPNNLKNKTTNLISENSQSNTSEETTDNVSFKTKPVFSKQSKKKKLKNKLLIDIDTILKKGRKLRESITYNMAQSTKTSSNSNDSANNKYYQKKNFNCVQSDLTNNINRSIIDIKKSVCHQESQTENVYDLSTEDKIQVESEISCRRSDSLSFSTSTSYKSPPSEIHCNTFYQLLRCLENSREFKENFPLCTNKSFKKKNQGLKNALQDISSSQKENIDPYRKNDSNPTLKYYISKLLNMSREHIASLNISSENHSVSNATSLDIECFMPEKESENSLTSEINKFEKSKSKNSEPSNSEKSEIDEDKTLQAKNEQNDEKLINSSDAMKTSKEFNLEEKTEKCAEKIKELSNLLNKLRQDKKYFFQNTIINFKDIDDSNGKEKYENRFDSFPFSENSSFLSVPFTELSSEFYPDVMDELLKREILSSPFKWSH